MHLCDSSSRPGVPRAGYREHAIDIIEVWPHVEMMSVRLGYRAHAGGADGGIGKQAFGLTFPAPLLTLSLMLSQPPPSLQASSSGAVSKYVPVYYRRACTVLIQYCRSVGTIPDITAVNVWAEGFVQKLVCRWPDLL
jgi:hypothetical protein